MKRSTIAIFLCCLLAGCLDRKVKEFQLSATEWSRRDAEDEIRLACYQNMGIINKHGDIQCQDANGGPSFFVLR